MSELEEFEKWWIRFAVDKLHHKFTSDEHLIAEHSWQACAERKDMVIEEQTAELEALRGFAEEVLDNLHRPCRLYLTELAQKWMLFDEHVQPTPLLTGKK